MTVDEGIGQSHPLKTFPVFPVNSPFTGPGEGKGVIYREEREDREG